MSKPPPTPRATAWAGAVVAALALLGSPGAALAQAAQPPASTRSAGLEPSTAPAGQPAPQRLGPVTLTGDGWHLGVGMGVQLRGTLAHRLDEVERPTDGVFELRRARVFLRGGFAADDVRFKLQLDVAPRALELIDLAASYRVSDAALLRAGIAKIPFSDHWEQSFLRLAFVDWPLTTRWFGGGRQLGLTLFDPREEDGWRYAVGLYTGETTRAANGARFIQLYGERAVNRSDLRDDALMGVPHPELAGRVTFHHGPLTLALSGAWDLRPVYRHDESLRLALDGRLDAGAWRLWAGGFASLSQDAGGATMWSLTGSLLELAYRPDPQLELSARHAFVLPTASLRADAGRYAAQRLAALVASAPGEQRARYLQAGHILAEHEVSLAGSHRIIGDDLKWTTDASWLHGAGVERHELRLRSQLQVAF